MARAILCSLILHILLGASLYWSRELDALLKKSRASEIKAISAELLLDKTYKPTDTPMKLGSKKKDLPPPNVLPPKSVDKDKEKKASKKKEEKETSLRGKKAKDTLKDILKNIREQAKEEKRPPPKEDNFPTHEKGQKGARGTGGRGDRALSPGEQALQAAMRKHYELEGAEQIRKNFPSAIGFMSIRLIGIGSQFEIVSLSFTESTGLTILDRKCEVAVRQALQQESFAKDVIQELNGKETLVTCRP